MSDEAEGSALFAVFAFSILSLVLIPWTIYKLCNSESSSRTFELAEKRKAGWIRRTRDLCTISNVVLVALWILAFALVAYIQRTQKEQEIFDPFEILQVPKSAEEAEIKKAYKELARMYHPDKNPDPKATEYFVEKITKAHAALTDPISKENYLKHGHPDGPQGTAVGIAMPPWILKLLKEEKTAPIALLAMVACFILLPLAIMGCFLFRSNKFMGPNNIMQDTMGEFMYSKYNVKESQGLARIPETLMVAREFTTLFTPNDHQPAVEELRKLVLREYSGLKDKATFWKRRASVIKAHLLLLAHLERLQDSVPSLLQNDMKYVLERSLPLLEQIVKIACLPRRPHGYGWLSPVIGAIQMAQCIVQAVSINSRKQMSRRNVDGHAALLQLPGMDSNLSQKMQKKKVQALSDLMKMDDGDREDLLNSLGLPNTTIQSINTALAAIPQLTVTAECVVDGEDEIIQGDIVTCRVHLVLTRRSHESGGFTEGDLRGDGAQAFAPYYPYKRTEKWYIILAYQPWNSVLTWTHTNLKEAEVYGLQYGDPIEKKNNGQASSEADLSGAQTIEMKFPAHQEGNFDLQVICMSDSWIGCDQTIPVRVSIKKFTKARESARSSPQNADSDDENTGKRFMKTETDTEGSEDPGDMDPETSDEEAEDKEEYDYDTDETGELETDEDGENDGDDGKDMGNGTSTDEEIPETEGLM